MWRGPVLAALVVLSAFVARSGFGQAFGGGWPLSRTGTATLTNKTIDANDNTLKFTIQVPAQCASPSTGGAASATDSSASNRTATSVFLFDALLDEEITCTVFLPTVIDTASVAFAIRVSGFGVFTAATCGGASETVLFTTASKTVTASAGDSDDNVNQVWDAGGSISLGGVDCSGGAHVTHELRTVVWPGPPTLSGMTGDDVLLIRLTRDADDAGDVYDGDFAILNPVSVIFGVSQ